MTVTIDQAATLLAVAAAFDQRTIGRSDATAWQVALDDVDFEASRDAIIEHYRQHRERVTVAEIRGQVRGAQRRRADQRHDREVLTAARAIPSGLAGTDPHDGMHNSVTLEALHFESLHLPCRGCGAIPGQRCHRADRAVPGGRVATKIPHPQRVADAGKAQVTS